MKKENDIASIDKLAALCKRRGFIFQGSEIYGGINGFWDYGPLGVELKRNIKNAWWNDLVHNRDDIVGIDSAIIMNPKVWQASGHLGGFSDPMLTCRKCRRHFREDHLEGEKEKCPSCGGELTEPRQFNLMFKTYVGAMEDSSSEAYLRPETAQGIFCNYKNVLDSYRIRTPFGIAQLGKSFRNEINPRNYTFRSREFEQMEIEFFCHPREADEWYSYWRRQRFQWYVDLGLRSSRLRLRDHEKDELAHYAASCADVEYEFPFGVSELEGISNRTDFDLKQHQQFSGKDMTYFDDQTGEKFIPYVIEPSGGVDRAVLAFLCEGYTEDKAPDNKGALKSRTLMKLHPRLAPFKVAVFPLVKKEGMPEAAMRIYDECRKAGVAAFYDQKGAIGRRYRRQDEAGTPFCVTVDGQTAQDDSVTIRERDSLSQERIPAGHVADYVMKSLA